MMIIMVGIGQRTTETVEIINSDNKLLEIVISHAGQSGVDEIQTGKLNPHEMLARVPLTIGNVSDQLFRDQHNKLVLRLTVYTMLMRSH